MEEDEDEEEDEQEEDEEDEEEEVLGGADALDAGFFESVLEKKAFEAAWTLLLYLASKSVASAEVGTPSIISIDTFSLLVLSSSSLSSEIKSITFMKTNVGKEVKVKFIKGKFQGI